MPSTRLRLLPVQSVLDLELPVRMQDPPLRVEIDSAHQCLYSSDWHRLEVRVMEHLRVHYHGQLLASREAISISYAYYTLSHHISPTWLHQVRPTTQQWIGRAAERCYIHQFYRRVGVPNVFKIDIKYNCMWVDSKSLLSQQEGCISREDDLHSSSAIRETISS